jgi:hypothetical protein
MDLVWPENVVLRVIFLNKLELCLSSHIEGDVCSEKQLVFSVKEVKFAKF